jgi:hypothetical protein
VTARCGARPAALGPREGDKGGELSAALELSVVVLNATSLEDPLAAAAAAGKGGPRRFDPFVRVWSTLTRRGGQQNGAPCSALGAAGFPAAQHVPNCEWNQAFALPLALGSSGAACSHEREQYLVVEVRSTPGPLQPSDLLGTAAFPLSEVRVGASNVEELGLFRVPTDPTEPPAKAGTLRVAVAFSPAGATATGNPPAPPPPAPGTTPAPAAWLPAKNAARLLQPPVAALPLVPPPPPLPPPGLKVASAEALFGARGAAQVQALAARKSASIAAPAVDPHSAAAVAAAAAAAPAAAASAAASAVDPRPLKSTSSAETAKVRTAAAVAGKKKWGMFGGGKAAAAAAAAEEEPSEDHAEIEVGLEWN